MRLMKNRKVKMHASMIYWSDGWTENLHDILLVLVAFSTGINAIATGALTDMHTPRNTES